MFRKALFTTAIVLGIFTVGAAQITPPNIFSSGQLIESSKVNADFAKFADALNRTAGTMTGTLTSQQITPSTTATYDIGTSSVKFRDFFFSRNGLIGGTLGVTGNTTISGQLLVGSGPVTLTDSTGKIQAISSTYFADLSGASLTTLNASNISSGTLAVARLPSTDKARATNGAQSITNNTEVALTFSAETFDTNSLHSTSSNTSRMTIGTTGYYNVIGEVGWLSAGGSRTLKIKVNNTTFYNIVSTQIDTPIASYTVVSDLLSLTAGDYVELIVIEVTGADLDTVSASFSIAARP